MYYAFYVEAVASGFIGFYYPMVVGDSDGSKAMDFGIVEKTLRQSFKPLQILGNGRTMQYRKNSDRHNPRRSRPVTPNAEGILCQKIDRP